jgi:hypothetical protein
MMNLLQRTNLVDPNQVIMGQELNNIMGYELNNCE